ncbi:MAG: metallophosphoesterase [Verrucomicrobiales bacterium]|nr:metallophosphoesterase [Verrucomicrobiales bacterium]
MNTRMLRSFWLGLAATSSLWAGDVEPPPATQSPFVVPPFVQPLGTGVVSITWETAEPSFGWVEYGETETLGRRAVNATHGLLEANVRTHRVVLEGLRPGTDYHYRVTSKPIHKFAPYSVDFGPGQSTEIAIVRTLPGVDDPVTAIIYNDLHSRPATLQAVQAAVRDVDADLTMFNGDCLADPTTAADALVPLSAYIPEVGAGSRPVIFIRGNHETRGAFARRLPDYFSWPGHRPYFAFTAGPVRWVILDYGEDKPDEHPAYSGLVDFDSFRKEETEWLKAEVVSEAFRSARWRVLVHHIPLYSARRNEDYQKGWRKEWADLLAGAHVDLALNGHTHRPAFHPAGSLGNPYPILVGGGPDAEQATVMVVEADPDSLSVRLLSAKGEELFPRYVAARNSP